MIVRRLTITNGHLPTLVKVCQLVGGKIYACPLVGKNKQSFQWYCYGDAMDRVLNLVMPYLVVKRREAEIAVSFTELRKAHDERIGRPLTEDTREKYRYLLKEVGLLRRRDYHPKFIPPQYASKKVLP